MRAETKKLLSIFSIFVIFFLVSFLFNKIPKSSIVAGGDFYQLPDYIAQLDRYKYAWFLQAGQGSYNPLFTSFPFYAVLSGLDFFLTEGAIASSLFFGFTALSFLSFFFSSKLVFSKLDFYKRILVSLFYAINPFVITIFTYSWGFTHHFLIYLIFPLFIFSFSNILLAKKLPKIKLFSFFLVNLLAVATYNNISFAVLNLLVCLVLTILSYIFRYNLISFRNIFKNIILFSITLLVALPLFYPIASSVILNAGKSFNNHEALGGENYLYNWIKSTSSSSINLFQLSLDNYRYPFESTQHLSISLVINSTFFIALLFLLYLNRNSLNRDKESNKFLTLFICAYLLFFFLSARYFGPFEQINKLLYQSPFFIFFRSSEKIFIPYVFFFTATLMYLLEKIDLKKKKVFLFFFVFALFFPVITGVIRNTLENSYNKFAGKKIPEYKYIVTIPEQYLELSEAFNHDVRQTAILSLPYSVKNSINWSNYPKWNFVGQDVLHVLFNKRYISANSHDNPALENMLSFKNLNSSESGKIEVKNNIEKFGTQFLIYHKDIDRGLYNKAKYLKQNIDLLNEEGFLNIISDNNFFTAYELRAESIKPLIEIERGSLSYKKINPALYKISIDSSSSGQLRFLQSFDTNWTTVLVEKKSNDCQSVENYQGSNSKECTQRKNYFLNKEILSTFMGKRISLNHNLCLDYANCWEIEDESLFERYDLYLYYANQNIVYFYSVIIAITILTSSLIVYSKCKKK